jgi:hypothetical protein
VLLTGTFQHVLIEEGCAGGLPSVSTAQLPG